MMERSSALQLLCLFAMAAMAPAFDIPLADRWLYRFIRIDCGSKRDPIYRYPADSIYISGSGYVDSGTNVEVPWIPSSNLETKYWTMRVFPNGTRNCYTVWPVIEGDMYIVRAEFFYGNYDDKNSPPEFDLYLGVNFWQRVETKEHDFVQAEVIVRALGNFMDVCLVKTGAGTPFISVLDIIPVDKFFYKMVNNSHSLFLREKRVNFGGKETTSFFDSYNRIWFPSESKTGWTSVSTHEDINREESGMTLSYDALSTAIVSQELSFRITVHPDERNYLFLYFAELEQFGLNETREFNVFEDGKLWYGPYRPKYLKGEVLYASSSGGKTTYLYSLTSTSNSTRPPLINALEVYGLRKLKFSPTDPRDRAAIWKIKEEYGVKKNWQGDPCLPHELSWEGVGCLYDDFVAPRIISLNLSMSRLEGDISPSLVNLTLLTSLDLSNNDLKGIIPDVLMNLWNLKVMKLSNNQLNGSIPDVFYSKSKTGALLLSIDGNTELCKKVDFCHEPSNEKMDMEILVSATFVIALAVILLLYLSTRKHKSAHRAMHDKKFKRRKRSIVQSTRAIPLAKP